MIDRVKEFKNSFESELSDFQLKIYQAIFFLFKFSFFSLPLYALLWLEWNPVWLRSFNASVSSGVLSFLGIQAKHVGTKVVSESLLLDVSTDSTGWKSFFALSALIFSAEKGNKQKLLGVIISLPAIFSVNLLRIVSMVFLVEVYKVSYELLHTLLWRWGLTLFILVFWLTWLNNCSD